MNTTQISSRIGGGDSELEARLGTRLAALLNQSVAQTPHDITERLRFARERALIAARKKPIAAAVRQPVFVLAGHRSAAWGRQPSWFTGLASLLPLMMLVVGLFMIDRWNEHADIQAAAEVDTALLSDELPPDAYTDPGFVEFLKSSRN